MSGIDPSAANRSITFRWRDRFYAARWVLLACSLVFLVLYLANGSRSFRPFCHSG